MKFKPAVWLPALIFAFASQVPVSAQLTVEVMQPVYQDVSPTLRSIEKIVDKQERHQKPKHRLPPHVQQTNTADPALQTAPLAPLAPATSKNFDGVGQGVYGFAVNSAPPDTNGSVGATQYVQWVNSSFAIFDKATGALIQGPTAGNAIWSGFGGGCQTNNDGDPILQYDKAAQRWVFSQFSISTTPYLQCFAISTTSDATGSYYRYSFSFTNFPDYPKLGIWPDAYYASFNMFSGNSFTGARACAYDRAKMLTGAAATGQCFQLSTAYGGLLPSDLDGSTPPPAGSPNFFVAYDVNALFLWKFHVDFNNPANSTFVGPGSVAGVAAFSPACNGGGVCIPQSGTNQQLDSLADRLMYRLAYRNFGDHEALVVNHSVNAGSSVGVRWYEVRSPNATPTVFQQGTYAPDANYRWMGSIAMDKAGNMGMGYSVSSSTMHPSIRFTGRASTDPLGSMQTETTVIDGTGSQVTNLNRWGDYSSMSIDPVDDCTFWYTTEYLKVSGTFNWNTRIANFQFPGCAVAPGPDFSISSSPASQTVTAGAGTTYSATVAPSGGFTGTVNFSVTGLPAGANASFSPATVTTSGSTTMSVTTTSATPAGSYSLAITGTSGTTVHSSSATLVVNAVPVPDFTMSRNPASLTLTQGAVGTSTVTVASTNSFSSGVGLAITGCPSTATCSINPASVTPAANGSATATLSVSTTSGTTPGAYTVTVTGTSGSLSHATSVSVQVNAPAADFTLGTNVTSLTVARGASGSYTVNVGKVNATSAVTLSVSGLPGRTTASFSPNPVNSGGSSLLTITANRKASTATRTLTITGNNGSFTHSTTVTLTIK